MNIVPEKINSGQEGYEILVKWNDLPEKTIDEVARNTAQELLDSLSLSSEPMTVSREELEERLRKMFEALYIIDCKRLPLKERILEFFDSLDDPHNYLDICGESTRDNCFGRVMQMVNLALMRSEIGLVKDDTGNVIGYRDAKSKEG